MGLKTPAMDMIQYDLVIRKILVMKRSHVQIGTSVERQNMSTLSWNFEAEEAPLTSGEYMWSFSSDAEHVFDEFPILERSLIRSWVEKRKPTPSWWILYRAEATDQRHWGESHSLHYKEPNGYSCQTYAADWQVWLLLAFQNRAFHWFRRNCSKICENCSISRDMVVTVQLFQYRQKFLLTETWCIDPFLFKNNIDFEMLSFDWDETRWT